MKITKSVKRTIEAKVSKKPSKKEKLVAEATELGIETKGMTTGQLEGAIAEANV